MTKHDPAPPAPDAFYDPDLYEMKLGPGPRVAALYVPLALAEGGPVLELGCGTGDVLLPIARAGIACWGIDTSAAMLARARTRIATEDAATRALLALAEGDMADFRLDARFRQVFFTNDVIGHLLSNDDLVAAFRCAAGHLLPGGRLVCDVTAVDVAYLARATDPWANAYRHRGRAELAARRHMDVYERTEYCEARCRLTAHFRYEHVEPDGTIARTYSRTLVLRPRHPEEIVLALRLAGLSDAAYEPISRGEGDRAWLITAWRRDGEPAAC
ncbi:class I SAM-dependent methyltransferase [Xanthobacteraceae bacterium A53D]